jgi:hypothetical protein
MYTYIIYMVELVVIQDNTPEVSFTEIFKPNDNGRDEVTYTESSASSPDSDKSVDDKSVDLIVKELNDSESTPSTSSTEFSSLQPTWCPMPNCLTKKTVKDPEAAGPLDNQDSNQRLSVCLTVLLELYRVATSSLLILFVPQLCIDHVCSLNENMVWENDIYNSAIVFNFITLFTFVCLYVIEIRRENRLIKFLDVNAEMPNDDENVKQVLATMPLDKRQKILSIDKQYQMSCYVSVVIYVINIILSGIVVNKYYLNNQTTSTFITYVLFMFTKLGSVYEVANTNQNVFYSSYLKKNIQFNDIDKTYKDSSEFKDQITVEEVVVTDKSAEDDVV